MSNRTLAELEAENAQLRSRLAEIEMSGPLNNASLKAGVRAEAFEDVAQRFKKQFADPNTRPTEADISAWLVELKASAHHLFSPGTGYHREAEHQDRTGVLKPGVNPFRKATLNLTQQAELLKQSPEKFAQMKAEAIAAGEWNPRD